MLTRRFIVIADTSACLCVHARVPVARTNCDRLSIPRSPSHVLRTALSAGSERVPRTWPGIADSGKLQCFVVFCTLVCVCARNICDR